MEEEIIKTPVQPLPQEVVPETPKKNSLKTVLLVFLGLFVIAGAVYAGIKIGRKQILPNVATQPTVTPQTTEVSPTPDETANWKTYTNSTFGISFKYPSDYKVTLLNGAINLQKNSTRALLYLSEFSNPNSLEISQWFNSQPKEDIQPIIDTNTMTETTVGGQKGLKFIKNQPETGYKDFSITVGYKTNVYSLNFGPLENEVDISNQILSTFKFTSQEQSDETVNWQTYTNATFGFSITYPLGWRIVDGNNLIGFGPMSMGEDVQWVINIYSDKTVDQIIAEMGDQFADRSEKRNKIIVNGLSVTEAVVTTPSYPSWVARQIIIPSGNKIIAISNGAVEDSKFVDFYQSFKLLK